MNHRLLSRAIAACALGLLSGCDRDLPVLGPQVSVEKRIPEGCYAPCEGQPVPLAWDAFTDRCPASQGSVSCGFQGGVDQVRVVASYDELRFEDPAEVPSTTVQLVLDDREFPATFTLVPQPRRVDEPTITAGVFTVPGRSAGSARMRVGVDESYRTEIQGFTIAAAAPSMTLPECQGATSCSRQRDVGRLAVTLSTAIDDVDTTVTLSTALDGIPQPARSPVELQPSTGGRRETTTFLDVPKTGATWTIEAKLGTRLLGLRSIELLPPQLDLKVQGCPEDPAEVCELAAGSPVIIQVTGPRELRTQQADLISTVNGVQAPVPLPVQLDREEGAVRWGILGMKVPGTQGDTWILRAIVGGASVSSRPVAVRAP